MKNTRRFILPILLITSHFAHAKWEIYTDTVLYNYSVSYPGKWKQEIHGVNLVLTSPNGEDSIVIAGDAESSDVKGGISVCKQTRWAGQPSYDCPNGSFVKTRAIYFPLQKIIINQTNPKSRTAKKIISSFRFISNSNTAQPGGAAEAPPAPR